jgi:ribosomal protein L37AE/L43A
MSNTNEVLKSAKDIVSNMEDLVNDIANLDEHEHDENECNDCETVYESGKENHDHDVWNCSDCESMLDESVSDKISTLDVNDLMDQNYDLWQTVGEEAVQEFQERTGGTVVAITELARLVNELYDTVDSTDLDDVNDAIVFLTNQVYGVRETPKPDIIEEVTINLPSDSSKCPCGADHSVVDYTNKED